MDEGILKKVLKHGAKALGKAAFTPLSAGWGRLMALGLRPPPMVGCFPDRGSALASLPAHKRNGYDQDDVATVNFTLMSQKTLWDYPVLFWLERLHAPGLRILDAGGHFGTKYIAFRNHLPVQSLTWTVFDLPATIRAARMAQAEGEVPAEVVFCDALSDVGRVDLLLASGLMQYVDRPLAAIVGDLDEKPRHILLNKVATREGPSIVTLEKIGPSRVPYQIRSRGEFEQELKDMGYRIRDSWEIPSLSRMIATHPGMGPSKSLGYCLERI